MAKDKASEGDEESQRLANHVINSINILTEPMCDSSLRSRIKEGHRRKQDLGQRSLMKLV